ncbi:MAG: hypothetical protein V4651_14150 [Bacteroidota bacterium]
MSLSGTTWSVIGDSNVDKWTMTFNNDGTVTISGGGPIGYYAESNGDFIIQEPKTTANPNIGTVWSGSYVNAVGHGLIQTYPGTAQNYTAITNFYMTKQ